MSLRVRAVLVAALFLALLAMRPVGAEEFTDAAGRIVNLPSRVNRVMPASLAAEALIFVLNKDKLASLDYSFPAGPGPGPHYIKDQMRLPVPGEIAGPNAVSPPEAAVGRVHPDLIIDSGPVTPERAALADQVTQATGVPYILLDSQLDRIPSMLRVVGRILGVADRGDDLAGSAEHAINALRGRLLIQPANQRPRVYVAMGDGLITTPRGSEAAMAIDAAGAINVATDVTAGPFPTVTLQQLHEWNPDIIIATDHRSYWTVLHTPGWAGLAAVRKRKVFLEPYYPPGPFPWITSPAGVNQLIGLYWLSQLFYPGDSQDDLRTLMADFYDKFYGIKLTDPQIEAIAKEAGIPPSDTPHMAALPSLSAPLPGVPGAVNEPGRRGVLPNPAPATTPSYLMPK